MDSYTLIPTVSYKVFYGIGGCSARITQKNIGLDHSIILVFDIPKSEPESYYDPLDGLDPILDLMEITPCYSETASILFMSDIWDYDKENPTSAFKSFPVKFERNGDFGKITFKDIKWKAGDKADGGAAIVSTAFATYVKSFYGTIPKGLSMSFRSSTYIPNYEDKSWFKINVGSMMYYLADADEDNAAALVFVIKDDIYQKTKVYFCDIDGNTHNEIGMDGEYILYFNIYAADDNSITFDSLKSTQTVEEAL